MSRPKKLINKQTKKKYYGRCFFCNEDDYNLLDTHRIVEGGHYTDANTLITCANCHRKIHSKKIIIHGKHPTTKGVMIVHFTIDGQEHWKYEEKHI